MYLNDWLIWALDPERLVSDTQVVLNQVSQLGCLINDKGTVNANSVVQFPEDVSKLEIGVICPSLENREKVRAGCRYLRQYRQVTARGYLSFLGILSHTADYIPMGRLSIRSLQFHLKCFWQRNLGLHFVIHLN